MDDGDMGDRDGDVKLILVGVDGSDQSRRALTWAAGLAHQLDAEVLAVHAAGLLEHMRDADADATEGPSLTERFERDWCAPLDDAGVRSRRLVVDGPPPLVMLRVAEEEAVDLIVVGSRGIGGSPAQLLGSTSRHLVENAVMPVTVLPAAG
jgi:nucleotide-binding universal stress UspA family protein